MGTAVIEERRLKGRNQHASACRRSRKHSSRQALIFEEVLALHHITFVEQEASTYSTYQSCLAMNFVVA